MRVTREEFTSMLGQGFHTAFRKGTDCKESAIIWNAINDMSPDDWHAVLVFVAECFKGTDAYEEKEI